ncbi:Hypothetical protein R9X50_00498400 [Acrodontium crateriforme]|uniref:Uncharacterized protein n=1 Tax=Acrodontium crateriforme TaxID=150365 RepID=A0AAQ3R8T1_9PEZI|nr:Hypothetical protein R9X50_00498400 [Acrodontium crateriforme]
MAKKLKTPSFKPSSAAAIPAPFSAAPPTLEPFLDRLDPSKVYIAHVDRHPAAYKKQIFIIPVLLNGGIAALLAWRIYVVLPVYWAMIQAMLGYMSAATVDVGTTTRSEQFWILARRVGMMVFDFGVLRLVGPWPVTFFLEWPANPVSWRWGLGFREQEVVVRVSRHWGTRELMQGVKQGEDNAFFKTRVGPAIERLQMCKTGYLMMDQSWDLDFELMLDAHALAKAEQLQFKDIDHVVFAYQEGLGWLQWQWRGEGADVDIVEDRRKKVVMFKDKLTDIGKESLFWRWMEIVEEERDRDGGFTPERQQKVATRVQAAFEAEGVDFDQLTKSIGGLEEIPAKQ